MKIKILLNTSIFVIIFGISISSCQKEVLDITPQTKTTDSTILKKVLIWLDKKNKPNARSIDSSVGYIKQNLIGNELRIEKFNDKERLIIIPLKDDFKTLNVTTEKTFKNLVIIENEKGEYRRGNIIEIIPKDQKYNKVPENLISKVYNNKSNELNGTFSILTITNKFIYELGYNKNKLTYTKYLSKKPGKSGGRRNDNAGRTNQMCIDWYWVTTYYNADGSTTENWQYLYRTCNENDCYVEPAGRNIDKDKISYKVNCGGDDPGNPTTELLTLVSVDTLKINLYDTCLIKLVENITDIKLKNEISKLYQQTFIGYGDRVNLTVTEINTLFDENGSPKFSESLVIPSKYEWVVNINKSFTSYSSNEFMGFGILHELVHSFVFLYANKANVPLTDFDSHIIIFENWVNQIRDALIEIYSVNSSDATALALQGMDDILMKSITSDKINFKNKFNQFAIAKYGMNLYTAANIRIQYETGQKGSKCRK
ncbi:MAG: hypothetical protein WKF85_15720 [Chitinophagaceae bacterium]